MAQSARGMNLRIYAGGKWAAKWMVSQMRLDARCTC
jgi:hypothetical protein